MVAYDIGYHDMEIYLSPVRPISSRLRVLGGFSLILECTKTGLLYPLLAARNTLSNSDDLARSRAILTDLADNIKCYVR